MDHGAELELLRVGTHGPACHENDNARDEIAFRAAVAFAAEPDAEEASTPPDDAHARVLQIVFHPGTAPAVLGEGVDAAPSGDDEGVEELLTTAGAPKPELADEQEDGKDDAVADEGAAHDEMRKALA